MQFPGCIARASFYPLKDIVAFFKFLIIAGIAVALALASYVLLDAYMSKRIFVPTPPPTEHEIAVAARWLEINFLIKVGLWILALFALFAAIMRFLVVPATNARERISYDPQTGMLPLVRRNVAPFWKRITGHNEYDELDGNLAATPHRKVWSNGKLDVVASTHGIAPESQVEYARGSWGVQGSVARKGRGMSIGEARFASGEFHARAQKEKERAEMMREKRLAVTAKPVAALPAPKVEISAMDGFAYATDTQLPMGFTDSGKVVCWDVEQSPHVRVHGKTQGSGKTNLIKIIAAGALRAGHAVIVLDRRGFKDWAAFSDCAEMIDNRQSGVFACVASQVETFYRDRDAQLGRAGVGNLAALTGDHRRVFVIVAEFGTACRSQEEHHLLAVVNSLKNIFSEAGATGVHLVFEDQIVNRSWPRELRGNADPITGYLPEDAAKGGGYAKAHELDPYQFHYEGERFRTWDMRQSAIKLLAKVPPLQSNIIDIGSVRSFVRSVDNHKKSVEINEKQIVFAERTNERTAWTPTELQALVWKWRAANPNGQQADMRRDFSERGIQISRGYAHQCWHTAKEVRP